MRAGGMVCCSQTIPSMLQVWQKLGRAVTSQLREEVHDAMLVFDKDANGTMSFFEFVRLIARRPWKVLLPQDVQALLPQVSLKELQKTVSQETVS